MGDILIPVVTLGAMGAIFATILGFASSYFAVPVDETEANVREALPGANCGACGYPGCDGFAKAVAEGKAPITGCLVGGQKVADDIANVLGQDSVEAERMVATVMCQGSLDHTSEVFDYKGINDCRTIASLGSCKSCEHGCIGCGTCVTQCEYGAISIQNGVAIVDKEKCVACKKCINICPKNIIQLAPYEQEVVVKCSNPEFGKKVKDSCSTGCIGCGICVRLAPNEFEMDGKLAKVKYGEDFNIENAVKASEKCPGKCIFIDEDLKAEILAKNEEETVEA